MLDLDAIEARCAAATRGPWKWHAGRPVSWLGPHDARSAYAGEGVMDGASLDPTGADGRFIEHAREDVPALVARVRTLEAALAEIADVAVGTVRVLEGARWDEAKLLLRPVEERLREIQRRAEHAAHPDAVPAPEGGPQ